MKKILYTLILINSAFFTFGQSIPPELTNWAVAAPTTATGLVKRENLDPFTYKQGTRPKSGDMSFFLSITDNDIQSFEKTNPLSYMNFKYYKSDKTVWRLGTRLFKEKSVFKGDQDSSSSVDKKSNREYYVRVGIERHLSPNNMVDVYVGIDGLLGVRRHTTDNRFTPAGGKETGTVVSLRSFDYGINPFIGFQAFVADLPISIGGEVGLMGMGSLWYRAKVTNSVGGASTERYVSLKTDEFEVDPSSPVYKDLDARRFDLNTAVRINVCYYFTRK